MGVSSGEGHSGEPGGLVHSHGIKCVGGEDNLRRGGDCCVCVCVVCVCVRVCVCCVCVCVCGVCVCVCCVCVCVVCCVCVCVCVCLKGHTSLAEGCVVCHPNSPGWPCLGSTAVCLLGGVSKVGDLDPNQLTWTTPPTSIAVPGEGHTRQISHLTRGGGEVGGAGQEERLKLAIGSNDLVHRL